MSRVLAAVPTAVEVGTTVPSLLQMKGQRLRGEQLSRTGGSGRAAEIWTQVRLTPEPLLLTSDLRDGKTVGGGEGVLSGAPQSCRLMHQRWGGGSPGGGGRGGDQARTPHSCLSAALALCNHSDQRA